MRYKVTVKEIELVFDEWEEACEVAKMFVSQGYIVNIYVTGDDD